MEKRWVTLGHYLFIDLKSKSFYQFTSFSDTANLIKKYTQADSIGISGGWNFYYPYDGLTRTEPVEQMADTAVSGILYQRYKVVKKAKNEPDLVHVAYLRCDRKGTMFHYNKLFTAKIGCPMTRIDSYNVPAGKTSVSSEINFIRDSLTKEEERIFNAWRKYAEANPVNR